MRVPTRTVGRLSERFNAWFRPREPVDYRDAWRYSVLFALILVPYVVAHLALGNPIWPAFLVLVVPAMAAFTFGFAVRRGTARQQLLSLGVGVVGGIAPLALPGVRASLAAVGPAGILLLWLLGLLGLFGYVYPDTARPILEDD